MAAIEPYGSGTELLVKFYRKKGCVSRLILSEFSDNHYVCLTPAGNMVFEDFNTKGIRTVVRDEDRVIPLDMGVCSEDFGELPTEIEFEQLCDQALDLVLERRDHEALDNSHEVEIDADPTLQTSAPKVPLGPPPGRSGAAVAFGGRPPLSGGLGALAAALKTSVPARESDSCDWRPVLRRSGSSHAL